MPLPWDNNAPKRQKREARLDAVAYYYKRGWSVRRIQMQVMEDLGMKNYGRNTCWKDIQYLLAQWREHRVEDIDQLCRIELARIDDIIAELWQQWERSKTDYQKKSSKQKGAPMGDKGGESKIKPFQVERTTTDVISLGDVSYIAEIRANLIERRKLLGLYAPEKRELTGKDGSPLQSEVSVNIGDFTEDEKQELLSIARRLADPSQ